jgi:hypothetical protein
MCAISPYSVNFRVVRCMGIMSEKYIESGWIPFICHLEEIQEVPHTMCLCNATMLVMIFITMSPNLFAR